jgi:predicted neuraminidase
MILLVYVTGLKHMLEDQNIGDKGLLSRTLPKHSSYVRLFSYIVLFCVALAPALYHGRSLKNAPELMFDRETKLDHQAADMSMAYVCEDCTVPAVHGANVIETIDGGLLATWFGGSREGGKDVALWAAELPPNATLWTPPHRIVEPASTRTALGRYIKTLGNSVLARGEHDTLWLYFVSVSVGGWAMSSLNAIKSQDEGKTWDAPRRLITSPFLNVSTLNKTAPLYYADGTIGLPVYHELMGKYSQLLQLDQSGRVLSKIRITSGRYTIQPLLLALGPQQAIALMRDTGPKPGRVRISRSQDAGISWEKDKKLSLPNADSAVAGLRRPDGSLLLVYNDTESGRNSLALAISRDQGETWQKLKHFEQSLGTKSEFSYPYLIRTRNGTMHLVYTWNRERIRYFRFNDNWVDGGKP